MLLNQQRTVTRDIRNLYQAVATHVVRVRARLKAITSSESALEATETGYEVGTRNIVDVLQAQQLLFRSQFDYADSRYNYVLDLLLLKNTAGALVEDDLRELNSYTDPKRSGRQGSFVASKFNALRHHEHDRAIATPPGGLHRD